jgi:5-hydroxyisourate hydrolase-like protein (transthyretin family)
VSLSTHVLDATDGRPAVGVPVRLESRTGPFALSTQVVWGQEGVALGVAIW